MARYTPFGDGGSAFPKVVLDLADSTGVDDPQSLADGAITMDGEFFVVPVTANLTKQNGLGNAYKRLFPLPPELLVGDNIGIQFLLSFDGAPSNDGDWGVALGLFQPTKYALAGGIEHTGSSLYRANASALSSTTVAALVTLGAPDACGHLLLPGTWNGSNSVGGTAASVLNTGDEGQGAAVESIPNSTYDASLSSLVLAFQHRTLTTQTDVLRCRAAYRLVEAWSE